MAPKALNVLVTGGAGYVGCVLAPKLLAEGHRVTVYDVQYYGAQGLPSHPNLTVLKADIRDAGAFSRAVRGMDAVLHMACISNDPSFELQPSLGKSINFDCFEPMVQASKAAGVGRFIYVSSSSVYGVSESPNVGEDHPLKPLTDYSKYKALCEDVLKKHRAKGFATLVIRPATVCGYSPRMRFDLSVNILTNLAVNKRQITVFGGAQKRPNIHIDDLAELYVSLLRLPAERIDGGVYNAGYQNHTIAELAGMVQRVVEAEFPKLAPIEIVTSPTDDLRSYHISSTKIEDELGYRPRRTVEDAVRDICRAFKAGKFKDTLDDSRFFNVRTMKALTPASA